MICLAKADVGVDEGVEVKAPDTYCLGVNKTKKSQGEKEMDDDDNDTQTAKTVTKLLQRGRLMTHDRG
jgi:hypothetical protein